MLKLAKLLLVTPNVGVIIFGNATHKNLFRNTTTGNRLNRYIILHVYCGNINQPNMVEAFKDFRGSIQARLNAFGRS